MIRNAYLTRNNYQLLMFIFASENFNQAYKRMKYLQQYGVYRRTQAAQILGTQEQLTGKKQELEQGKKTMEQAQQKIGQAMKQMEQSAQKAADASTN
jgi:hypothetical protein